MVGCKDRGLERGWATLSQRLQSTSAGLRGPLPSPSLLLHPVPSPCAPRLRPICLSLSPLGPCRGALRSPLEQPQTHFGTAAETTSASQWMRDERWASFSYQTPTLEGTQGRGHLKSCLPCPGPALTGLHRAALGDPYSKGQGVPGHSYRRWHRLNGVLSSAVADLRAAFAAGLCRGLARVPPACRSALSPAGLAERTLCAQEVLDGGAAVG